MCRAPTVYLFELIVEMQERYILFRMPQRSSSVASCEALRVPPPVHQARGFRYGTGAVPGPVRAARRRGTVPDAARSRGAEMRTHRGAAFAQIVT